MAKGDPFSLDPVKAGLSANLRSRSAYRQFFEKPMPDPRHVCQ
jgi:hypothetical protein